MCLTIVEVEKMGAWQRNRYLAAYHELSRFGDSYPDKWKMIEIGDGLLRERREGCRRMETRARDPRGAERVVMIGKRVAARLRRKTVSSSISA